MPLTNYEPLVSVVIPVYRGADYVSAAIESVLAQTYENFEVIVVDDGSPDQGATRRAVERHIPFVRYIHQDNGGVASALNTGARSMRGEIFSWLSHDDLFVSDKLERQIEFIRKLGRTDVVLYSDYTIVDPNNVRLYDIVLDHELFSRQPLLAILRGATNGCTMLLPKAVFERVGYFDENLRHTQDYDFWDRVEDHFPLVHCPGIMVRQRVHPAQDSRKPGAVPECDALWLRLADRRDHSKKSTISGSPLCFLRGLRDFVAQTPYDGAKQGLEDRIARCIDDTLVTCVVDLPPTAGNLQLFLGSLVNQSHLNMDLVLVDRSGDETGVATERFADRFVRVETIRAHGRSAAEGRNLALGVVRDGYVVFAGANDVYLPNRIQSQLSAMQESGALISHASFFASCPGRFTGYALASSGSFGGHLYPQIIERCPIWMATAMFNSLIFARGVRFEGDSPSDDILFFIDLARRYPILGVDEIGVMLQFNPNMAPLNLPAAIESLAKLRSALDRDPAVDGESRERQNLEVRYGKLIATLRAAWSEHGNDADFHRNLFASIFVSPSIHIDFDPHGPF